MNYTDKKYIDVITVSSLAGFGLRKVVLAIGVFDGVHLGHQLLLKKLVDMGRELDAVPCALTFFPHPRQVLLPDKAPPLLLPPEEKNRFLHQFGMAAVVTIPFTRDFAAQGPEDFIDNCICSQTVEVLGIAVGANWHFGQGGQGGIADLSRIAAARNIRLAAVEEMTINGELISSTAIRRAVSGGLLEKAAAFMGRNYSLFGEVSRGYRVATNELQHPTANLDIKYGVLPPNGVYAGLVHIDGRKLTAAVNVGECPTFNRADAEVRVEVHILDFQEDLYGRKIELELVRYIREERTFSDAGALKQQITADVQQIRQLIED